MVQQAGKAAPAMVVAGAIAAGPQAHGLTVLAKQVAAVKPAARTTVTASLDAAETVGRVAAPARAAARTYTVRSGDTLSMIAGHFYHKPGDWPWLYQVNRAQISDPNLIYPGEVLRVPYDPPAVLGTPAQPHAWTQPQGHGSYHPRHASSGSQRNGGSQGGGGQVSTVSQQDTRGAAGLSGTLGCTGLEHLWESAGGSPAAAVTAASIAMAESGGNQYATGTVGERGYWQINPVNGSLSTYNPYGNARAAVIMSDDGTNWSPWTTYVDGAYLGRC